jgi:hypothetical protein
MNRFPVHAPRIPLLLAALAIVAWASHAALSPADAAPPSDKRPQSMGGPAAASQDQGPGAGQIHDLDDRLKALRLEYHSQLDPLQAQIKGLREKYDPEVEAWEEQRKERIEDGKAPEIQELDKQEAAELASLADREKAELDKTKERFADERKEIQKRFDEKRKDARGAKH